MVIFFGSVNCCFHRFISYDHYYFMYFGIRNGNRAWLLLEHAPIFLAAFNCGNCNHQGFFLCKSSYVSVEKIERKIGRKSKEKESRIEDWKTKSNLRNFNAIRMCNTARTKSKDLDVLELKWRKKERKKKLEDKIEKWNHIALRIIHSS